MSRVQALVSSIRNVVVTGGPQVIAIFNTRSRQFDFMEDDRLRPPQVDGLNVPHDATIAEPGISNGTADSLGVCRAGHPVVSRAIVEQLQLHVIAVARNCQHYR